MMIYSIFISYVQNKIHLKTYTNITNKLILQQVRPIGFIAYLQHYIMFFSINGNNIGPNWPGLAELHWQQTHPLATTLQKRKKKVKYTVALINSMKRKIETKIRHKNKINNTTLIFNHLMPIYIILLKEKYN